MMMCVCGGVCGGGGGGCGGGGGGGGGAPLNRFVFDICYPIDIFNGLNFGFVKLTRNSPTFQV